MGGREGGGGARRRRGRGGGGGRVLEDSAAVVTCDGCGGDEEVRCVGEWGKGRSGCGWVVCTCAF